MTRVAFLALLTLSSAASAQEFPNASSRIATTIGQLVIENESKADAIKALQQQLATAQAKIKELEDKVKADAK